MNNLLEQAKSLKLNKKEIWVMERRPLNILVEEMPEQTEPEILLCFSLTEGHLVGALVIAPDVSKQEVIEWALGCILTPMEGKPQRPGTINLTGGTISYLKDSLEQLGIQVSASALPHPIMQDIVDSMEQNLANGLPPYLGESDVDSETAAEFFSAAAAYYKLKPWKLFEYEMPIKVEISQKKKVSYWAIVMGINGDTMGLSLYRSLDDLKDLFDAENEEEAYMIMKNRWTLGFSYESIDEIGVVAYDECLSNHWALAGESAYPSVILMNPKDKEFLNRPDKKELINLITVMRSLIDFFKAHKKEVKDEEEISEVRKVEVLGKEINVSITFPAPEFFNENEEEEEEFPFVLMSEKGAEALSEESRAMDLVYQAWEEGSKSKRVKLAKQALVLSPDCADAYLILAQDATRDYKERETYIKQAVQAGERMIGEKEFKELEGNFWFALETRPYMRARVELAGLRMMQGDFDQAILDYQDMLRLNTNDNVGNRYPLWSLLLQTNRNDELKKSLTKYKGEYTAFYLYADALLNFRLSGESKKANIVLIQAIAANKYVVDYLLERKPLRASSSAYYSAGDEDEALLVAELYLEPWKSTEGAVAWLKKHSINLK